MKKIVEIRSVETFKILDIKEVTSYRKYEKICIKLAKIVERHDKDKIKMGQDTEYIVRIKKNSFLVKSDNFGYIVGLRR